MIQHGKDDGGIGGPKDISGELDISDGDAVPALRWDHIVQ
jgi:hypothetical protein